MSRTQNKSHATQSRIRKSCKPILDQLDYITNQPNATKSHFDIKTVYGTGRFKLDLTKKGRKEHSTDRLNFYSSDKDMATSS